MENIRHITLEISLKPFWQTDDAYIEKVITKLLTQWKPLLSHAGHIALLVWAADGSEILDYAGREEDSFAWAHWLCTANLPPDEPDWGVPRHYRKDPPEMTYGILKRILSAFRRLCRETYPGRTVSLGATFDIGPEFAYSDFKYHRHPEVLADKTGGYRYTDGMFVDCCKALSADSRAYAAYPQGIPEGLPFATFLGAQAECFLRDLGYDYLWLSNGLGFSACPWDIEGKIFRAGKFHAENAKAAVTEVTRFWTLFRENCTYPIQTRGTNLSLGMDYSTDGIDLYTLYHKKELNFLPPPNSPWAPLNHNYGLELIGYMSRTAVLPEAGDYLFRYYLHDPWFKNSTWLHRYGRQAHDIYLPLSLSRMDEEGRVCTPSHLSVFSVDTSYGTLPDGPAYEVQPHLLSAYEALPDAPAPFVWLYPAKEYCRASEETRLIDMFASDWFMSDAMNHTLPISTVLSTDAFEKVDFSALADSILLSPVPYAGSVWEARLFSFLDAGGRVILTGPLHGASKELLTRIGVEEAGDACTEVEIDPAYLTDHVKTGPCGTRLSLDPVCSLPFYDIRERVAGTSRLAARDGRLLGYGRDNLYWYCGAMTGQFKKGERLLHFPQERCAADGASLLRHALAHFGWHFSVSKPTADVCDPVCTLHRHDNAYYFSVLSQNTMAELVIGTPYGAPLLPNFETYCKDGCAAYRFPRATQSECRVFLSQETPDICYCREEVPEIWYNPTSRLFSIGASHGLSRATVTVFPPKEHMETAFFRCLLDGKWLDSRRGEIACRREGTALIASQVSGCLYLYIPEPTDWAKRHEKEAADALADL